MMSRHKKNIIELTRISEQDYRQSEKLPLILFCDNVRSLHNVGSVLRTADAFCFHQVIMGGITGVPPHPEISKSALGAERSVSWRHVDDAAKTLQELREQGWKIAVLEQVAESISLSCFKPSEGEKWVLVVGNEVEGVSQSLVDMADVCVEIPQCGVKHSLNVSISAALIMWQAFNALKS